MTQQKEYRAAALEAIARNTLKAFNPGIFVKSPASIPIEKLAEWLGLRIEYQCLRKDGRILGETAFDDTLVPVYDRETKQYGFIRVNRGTILLHDGLLREDSSGRLRFTCAHEIAHWLIHQEIYTGSRETAAHLNPTKSSDANPLIERQADILATALLMPAGPVKRAYNGLRLEYGGRDLIRAMADMFEVSAQAMGIFLRERGME